jgi:hypothetical protein
VKNMVPGIAACLFLLACTQHSPRSPVLPGIQFAVDSALVVSRLVDTALGFSFTPPRGWNRLPGKSLTVAQREATERSQVPVAKRQSAAPELLNAWNHPPTGSVVVVTSFMNFDTRDTSSTIQGFEKYYRGLSPNADIRSTVFSTKTFKVHQLMVVDDQRVNFKMVFSNPRLKKPIQFDFVVPRGSYPQLIKTIESVAGSIELYPSTPPIN